MKKYITLTIALLYALTAFSQNDTGKNLLHGKEAGIFISKQKSAKQVLDMIGGKIGMQPDWVNIHKTIVDQYPDLTADSCISVLKISYYFNDMKSLEPILLAYLKEYGKTISMKELNTYAWKIFSSSDDPKLLREFVKLFRVRLEGLGHSQILANWYDTYAGLLFKIGKKEQALKQQIYAYSILTGKELMLDPGNGEVLMGTTKADFLITALKIEKGINTWEVITVDSMGISLKKEMFYWEKLKRRLLQKYKKKTVDSLIAFAQVRYYKVNKQWDNYVYSLINYTAFLDDRTLEQKNTHAWQVFLYSNDKATLQTASNWLMEDLKNIELSNSSGYFDTYANLLYKAGNKKDAIFWQQKAVDNAQENVRYNYSATLKKMLNDERTW